MQEKCKREGEVAILTESSDIVGLGHLRRCIVLGSKLKDMGKKVVFFSNDYSKKIIIKNFMTFKDIKEYIPGSFEYVIRDFRNGSEYSDVEREVNSGNRVLLLDDKTRARKIANLVCDVFMTPKDVKDLPHGARTVYLYGLEYSIISNTINNLGKITMMQHEGNVDFLIYFSLWDNLDITYNFIKALDDVGYRGNSIIVLAKESKNYKSVESVVKNWGESYLINYTPDMMKYISKAKIIITKIGVTVLESFYLGKPCITVEPTIAHLKLHNNLSENYYDWPAVVLGMYDKIRYKNAAVRSLALLKDDNFLEKCSKRAKELVDGKGAERVVRCLLG